MRQPAMRQTNPLIEALVAYFAQTEEQPFGRQSRQGKGKPEPEGQADRPSSVGERMRKTEGPIKAETAKRAASERERLLRELDKY